MEKKIIQTTTDYSVFKILEGNRKLKDDRVRKIMQSINEVGYITSPILVNENMEVIDGQGRLAALERLRLPVEYIVHEGIGIEECRQMNIHQSNWTDYDYVQSYAQKGSTDYQLLQSLIDRFSLPTSIVIMAASGSEAMNGNVTKRVKSGNFKMTQERYEQAKWELGFAQDLKQTAKVIGGNTAPFYSATMYAYRNLNTEGRNRLLEVIRNKAIQIPQCSKVEHYLKYFDAFYNERQRKDKRIHLELQYKTDQI